jgi:hypothetical protein
MQLAVHSHKEQALGGKWLESHEATFAVARYIDALFISTSLHSMKKVLLSAALALAVVGSWAFYPNEAPTATGYLMVVGSGRPGNKSYVPEVITIQPDGKQQVQRLNNVKVGTDRGSTDVAVALHNAEVLQVNALAAKGWRLVSVAQSTVGVGATTETVYMMERR